MKLTPLQESAAFSLSTDQRLSFAATPKPFRISGPPGLIRLVQRGRSSAGFFWTEEPVFSRVREHAKRELARQAKEDGKPFDASFKSLVGLYIKLCLRNDLAICKDWTENFDSYVVLPLRPRDSIVAWVGPIRRQPYYSEPKAGDREYAGKKVAYDLAKNGVTLLASENQYVIDFDFPANRPQRNRLLGPFDF